MQTINTICEMTGKETFLPCSASGCPLFGDCITRYTKEIAKKKPKKTNGDRIRAMSDEELAAYFGQYTLCTQIQDKHSGWCDAQPVCSGCLVEWLKQPVKEEPSND